MKPNIIAVSLLAAWLIGAATAQAWQTLESHLSYQQIVPAPEAQVHLLKFSPKHYDLDILRAADHGKTRAHLAELKGVHPIIAAINASFFTPAGSGMGLLVRKGVQLRALRKAAWGVFFLKGKRPRIIHTRDYHAGLKPDLAIQSGPRLVIKGKTPQFKAAIPKRRSGICVTSKKEVILAVAAPVPITLQEFAQSLQPHCQDALNFDGGRSTQFYLQAGDKQLSFAGRVPVPNFLIVTPKVIPSNL